MWSIKINLLYILTVTIFIGVHSLIKLSTLEDKITLDETAILSSLNKLFAAFNNEDVYCKPRLSKLFAIHNYFVSITETYYDNVKKTIQLSRVNNLDNSTQHMIEKLNEVLNESDKNNASNGNDSYVERYIEKYIKKIKRLKEKYVFNKEIDKVESNTDDINIDKTKLIDVPEYNNNTKPDKKTGQNQVFNNDDFFWKPSGRRIFHGFRTRIKHYPFMASVQFFRKFQCAGSIIKDDLVITSASCLQLSYNNRFFRENPAFLSVQIGSDFYENGGDNIAVQEIYFYPSYNPKTLKNNLAIMRLLRRITFKKKHKRVRKIDIDRNAYTWIPHAGFDIVTVIGWGARDSSNIIYNPFKNRLSYAELEYYPLEDCQEYYSKDYVTQKNFCAGFFSKAGGACNRDAGGPAIMNGILLGVISFGSPVCGLPDSPTVFTKVGFYSRWIDNILDKEVPYIYKRTTTTELPIFDYFTKRTMKLKITPLAYTTKLKPLDTLTFLRQSHEKNYDDLVSSESNTKEVMEYLDKLEHTSQNENTQTEQLSTHKNQEILRAPDIQVTNFVSIIETTTKAESKLDLQESNESKETVFKSTTSRNQGIKSKIKVLIDNLEVDQVVKDTLSSMKNVVKTENSNESREYFDRKVLSKSGLFSSSEDDVGLSIATDPFVELITNTSRHNRYDRASESVLFSLVSQAIEDEIKREMRKRKNV